MTKVEIMRKGHDKQLKLCNNSEFRNKVKFEILDS